MKLTYITPCRHHVVLQDGNANEVGLITITHISDAGSHFVLNKTYEVTKESVAEKEMSAHFIFLANFCNMQDQA